MSDVLVPYKDVLYIDSGARVSGTSSNFTVNLAGKFNQPNNYDTITLINCSIPKSWFLIHTSNSTFTLIENAVSSTVSIPLGNYSFVTLATALSTALNTASTAGQTFTVTGSTVTGKYTFTRTVGTAVTSLSFAASKIGAVIGFETDVYPLVASVVTSVNVVNLQAYQSILIQCDVVGGQDTVLSQIVPTIPSYAQVIYVENTPAYVSKPLGNNAASSINFWLTDGLGNNIDLNGLNWQCTVTLYKEDSTADINLRDKKYKLLASTLNDITGAE